MTELKETLMLPENQKKACLALAAVILALAIGLGLFLRRNVPEEQKQELPLESLTPQDWLVSRAQIEQMAYADSTLGEVRWNLSDEALADLNRVLAEYEITSAEDVSQFLAQATVESLAGTALTEWGDEDYFQGRGYSAGTRGAGYLHLTFAYGQMAFAVWLMKKYVPELSEIEYVNPSNHSREEITASFHTALQTAANLGVEISRYSRVVYDPAMPENGPSTGADYIAEAFAWESAAYFWHISNISQAFLAIPCSLNTDIASDIVGGSNWQSRREAYAAIYPVFAAAESTDAD